MRYKKRRTTKSMTVRLPVSLATILTQQKQYQRETYGDVISRILKTKRRGLY